MIISKDTSYENIFIKILDDYSVKTILQIFVAQYILTNPFNGIYILCAFSLKLAFDALIIGYY